METQKKDLNFVLIAHLSWGLLPFFWHELRDVPPMVVLMNRIMWSGVLLALLLAKRQKFGAALRALGSRSEFVSVLIRSALISLNWLTFIWAISNGHIVEAGLGYFISPLLAVAMGALILGEELSRTQKYAILILLSGVLVRVVYAGCVPWIGLILAASFALYLVMRKATAREPLTSLFHEVLLGILMLMPASMLLVAQSTLLGYGIFTDVKLILTGPITIIPMLWLVKGLRSVELKTAAMIQYLSPTLNVLVGLYLGETLALADQISLPVIWLGILIFSFHREISAIFRSQAKSKVLKVTSA